MTYKVDKLLPTEIYDPEVEGGIGPFASAAKHNEHWVPYCEKAYAKEADSNYLTVVGLIVKDVYY